MKYLFALVALWAFSLQNIWSQENRETSSSLKFTIMPLSMVDFTPRLRFGGEFLPGNNWGYGIDYGFGSSWLNDWRFNSSDWGNDYSFYEIRTEIKYIVKREERFFLYCGTELFYLLMNDQLKNGRYQMVDMGNEIFFDRAGFNKQKYGMHLKGGISHQLSEHLNIDIYGGVGVAERIIEYSDVVNPVEGEGDIFVEWIPQDHLFEGESVFLHLSFGFRIGYIMKY